MLGAQEGLRGHTAPFRSTYETGNGKTQCLECETWAQKVRELAWGYEQLLQSKEEEIANLTQIMTGIEDKLLALNSRCRKQADHISDMEMQADEHNAKAKEQEMIITYLKERQVELLKQLEQTQNDLFVRTVQRMDGIEQKETKVLDRTETMHTNISTSELRSKSQQKLFDYGNHAQELNRLLTRNLAELEQSKDQKMILELKHRMAVLRSIELSVLK